MSAIDDECADPPSSYDEQRRSRALAIQVFKGYYKSDKPDGVISSGEAEVRHYAMETSISGGIVATICFSPSTGDGRRRGRRLFAGKTMENSRARILPRLIRVGPACARHIPPAICVSTPFVARSTSAKPTTQLKTRPMNEYKLLWQVRVTGRRLHVSDDGLQRVAYLNHHFICASQVDKQ